MNNYELHCVYGHHSAAECIEHEDYSVTVVCGTCYRAYIAQNAHLHREFGQEILSLHVACVDALFMRYAQPVYNTVQVLVYD